MKPMATYRDDYSSLQNVAYITNCGGADLRNAYSPEHLSREQLKELLQWKAASPHITQEMLVQAVHNRLHLGRLTYDDVVGA
jgi:hypothetical protein